MILEIDWLNFTFDDTKFFCQSGYDSDRRMIDRFLEKFPELRSEFADGETMTYCSYYDCGIHISDDIAICWDEDPSHGCKGVSVQIPSHGLPFFYSLFEDDLSKSVNPLRTLLQILYSRNCRVSRIDIPFDDYKYKENGFTPKWYCDRYVEGSIRTRMKKYRSMCSGTKGWTFYLGSRANGKLLRVYDKRDESKGVVDCVRYEVELHSSYSDNFCKQIIDNDQFCFGDLLTQFVEVIDKDKVPSNKSLCPLLPAWELWLKSQVLRENVVLTLSNKRRPVSFEKIEDWYNTTLHNSVVTFIRCIGWERFQKMYRYDYEHLPDRFKKIITDYRNLKGQY